jgi:hypothetical protein
MVGVWYGLRVSRPAPDDATGYARDECSQSVAHDKVSQGEPAHFSWRPARESIGSAQA